MLLIKLALKLPHLDSGPQPLLTRRVRGGRNFMKLRLRALALSIYAVLILASSLSARAQDNTHKLTAMDEFQLQLAADPQISPDGKKIVYVRRFADPMTDK